MVSLYIKDTLVIVVHVEIIREAHVLNVEDERVQGYMCCASLSNLRCLLVYLKLEEKSDALKKFGTPNQLLGKERSGDRACIQMSCVGDRI